MTITFEAPPLPTDPKTGTICPSISKYLYLRMTEIQKGQYRWSQATQRFNLIVATQVSAIASQRRRCDAHPDDHNQ